MRTWPRAEPFKLVWRSESLPLLGTGPLAAKTLLEEMQLLFQVLVRQVICTEVSLAHGCGRERNERCMYHTTRHLITKLQ